MNVVMNWKTAEIISDVFDSLSPFLPLLNCFESPAVQSFAIWTLNNLCANNRKKIYNLFQDLFINFSLFKS